MDSLFWNFDDADVQVFFVCRTVFVSREIINCTGAFPVPGLKLRAEISIAPDQLKEWKEVVRVARKAIYSYVVSDHEALGEAV